MTKVVVIKFKNGGKLYYFSPRPGDVYERNMPVVVETARGLEFAWVAYPEREVEDSEIVPPLKSIVSWSKTSLPYFISESNSVRSARGTKRNISAESRPAGGCAAARGTCRNLRR